MAGTSLELEIREKTMDLAAHGALRCGDGEKGHGLPFLPLPGVEVGQRSVGRQIKVQAA